MLRVAVFGGVHLVNLAVCRRDRRNHRALERASGNHDIFCFDHSIGGFHGEARATDITLYLGHLDAGAYRGVEFFRVGFEVIGHLVFAGEGIGIEAVEFQAREAVVPGRAIGNQRIPTTGAPGFGDTVALYHQVRHAESAQVFAHGHTGLPGAHYKRVYCCFIVCHRCALLRFPTRMAVGGCRPHSVQRLTKAKL
ncbi:hypothetical protein D3C78_666260 [compost metagenome]